VHVGGRPDDELVAPLAVDNAVDVIVALPTADDDLQIIRTLTRLASCEDPLTGEGTLLYGEEAATEYPDRVQFMLRSGLSEHEDRAELTA